MKKSLLGVVILAVLGSVVFMGCDDESTSPAKDMSGTWDIAYTSGDNAVLTLTQSGDSVSGDIVLSGMPVSLPISGTCSGSRAVTMKLEEVFLHNELNVTGHLVFEGSADENYVSFSGVEAFQDAYSAETLDENPFAASKR